MNYSAEADKAKSVRLIRHAQSAANAGLATTAPDSIPLTELGHTQAQILADQIVSPRFDHFVPVPARLLYRPALGQSLSSGVTRDMGCRGIHIPKSRSVSWYHPSRPQAYGGRLLE